MVPTAELRVFEPLDAFDEDERAYWARYAARGEGRRPARAIMLSPEGGIGRAIGTLVADREHADVRIRGGEILVCPHRDRLRLLAAVVAIPAVVPDELTSAVLDQEEYTQAAEALEGLRAAHPRWRNHILHSGWEVPLRWFLFFDDSERRVVRRRGESSIRYETTGVLARSRAEAALSVVQEAIPESGVVGLVAGLARWIGQFDRRAAVVLDYGDLSRLMGATELRRDRSCREVWTAVRALAEGDQDRAAVAYAHAADRWSRVRVHENLN